MEEEELQKINVKEHKLSQQFCILYMETIAWAGNITVNGP